jgi:ferredoxin-nitrate reductase
MVTATPADLAAQRVEFRPGVRIARIDRVGKAVIDESGARHGYDLLVLATGSRPAKRYQGPLPNAGVHGLRRRADAEAIRAQAGPGRRAIIVGAGLLGLELADALTRIGTDVTVLQRSDRLMGRQLDAKASAYLAEAMAATGVRIRFRADVDELIGEEGVRGARLVGGEELPCDLVVFATGTVANAELARAAVLQCSNGVIVDERMRTSDASIHAIGEVAEFRGQSAGTTAAAEEQARQLAEFLRGNLHAPYRGPVNANLLKVHGVRLASVGLAEAGPGMQELVLDDPALGVYQKCVIRDDRLLGVIMLGDTERFDEYRELVASGVELDERRRTLLRPSESRPVEGRLVCSCNQVGDATIARAIGELATVGRCELREVCATTRAGTACGSCRPEVAQLIERARPPEAMRNFSPPLVCEAAP